MTELNNNVLFCGYNKTGQHWILFFVMNYHNILMNKAEETVDWKIIGKFGRVKDGVINLAPNQSYLTGFPRMMWTEYSRSQSVRVRDWFDSFDKLFYLHRHPGDVMISMFHYFIKPKIFEKVKKIDLKTSEYFHEYVKNNIPKYFTHIEQTIDYADFALCYDVLRKDPSDFKKVVRLFYDDVDELVFQKALKFSSFENVDALWTEERLKELDMVRHTRDGRSGQYKERMNIELIEWIKEESKKRGLYKLWEW